MVTKDTNTLEQDSKYPLSAYLFVQRGLDFTVRRMHGDVDNPQDTRAHKNRHVSGHQLCDGLRDLALQEYGLMARTVLTRWNINSSEDFGRVVFAMVEAGLMKKTADDSLDDFMNVYDFDQVFSNQLSLSDKH